MAALTLATLACGALLLAAGQAADADRSWVHCWENGHTKEACCLSPEAQARAGLPSCFDSIFTRKECCGGGGGGWARLYPEASGEPPAWEAAAAWAARRAPAAEKALGRHPSFSREQRRWEESMGNASVLLSEEVFGQQLNMKVFKRSGPAMDVVLKELGEDLYRLRHIERPQDRETAFAVDIGASVGVVAVLLAKLWAGARIIAIEPAPANFRYLLWNIRINGVAAQVWPLNIAVGKTPSSAQSFYYSPTYPTWSQSTGHDRDAVMAAKEDTWRGGWTDWQVRFEVEAATLAELLAALGLPGLHFLKVDCEGCEWAVFEPLAWSRLRHRAAHVAAELHDWALPGDLGDGEREELQAAVNGAICRHEVQRENRLCSTA